MATAAVGRAGVDGMTVVDAATDCVAFDHLDTHDSKGKSGRLRTKKILRPRWIRVALDAFFLSIMFMTEMILIWENEKQKRL